MTFNRIISVVFFALAMMMLVYCFRYQDFGWSAAVAVLCVFVAFVADYNDRHIIKP